MASTYNDASAFAGVFKRVYGPKIIDLIPDDSTFQKLIPFKSSDKGIGEKYYESVTVSHDQGFTYSAPGDGIVTYADAIAGKNVQASIDSNTIVGQTVFGFDLVSRAMAGGSKAAFEGALDLPVTNFMRSFRNRVEIGMLYGGTSIGTVGSVSGSTITISAATWAAGLWCKLIGARLTIYVGSTSTARVSNVTITGMDLGAGTITVSDATAVAANDTIYIAGARGKDALGIKSILNTSGSLFGIDNTVYNLWKPNTYAVGGQLSIAKVEDAATLAADKGFIGDRQLFVNPRVWNDVMTEVNSSRQVVNGETNLMTGGKTVKIYSAVGTIEVIPNPMVMVGDGYLINANSFRRIGTCDVQLGPPGEKDTAITRLESKTGYQAICFTDQALFCREPGIQTYLSGITA